MRERYRMDQRNGGSFYAKDRKTGQTFSLATSDQRESNCLLAAKDQAVEQPCLNVAVAKVYVEAFQVCRAQSAASRKRIATT